MIITSKARLIVYANDLDAFIPEVWAQESLMVLEAKMVMANLVYRDFEDEIAQYGDVVNTRQPATFTAKRKTDSDSVTVQDASADNVPVKLDQHWHTTFIVKDGEESKGFQVLREKYLEPALSSIAQAVDESLVGLKYSFQANVVGKLGTTVTRSGVSSTQAALDTLLVPQEMRNMVVSPTMKGDLLNIDDFVQADKRGDDGTAMREGSLGRVFGLDTYMSQNCKKIATGATVRTGAVNNGAGYAIGDTAITIDGGLTPVAGEWVTIAGDMTPQFVTAYASNIMTISPGLRSAVVDDAVVTCYSAGAIDNASGYAIGYNKELTVDGFTVAIKPQGMWSTGITVNTRSIYAGHGTPTTTSLLPSHSLEAAVLDDALIGVGPAGEYAFAFHKNAVALVSRPLATPQPGAGALSYVAQYNGLGIRVTITYDGDKQGHRVTVDLLCGVKVLNTSLGCLLLG